MNNNFVVKIPSDLKKIKSKLILGLTKRQAIALICIIIIGLPIFFLLKSINLEFGMYGLFFVSAPVILCTIYQKDNLKSESWIKLILNYNNIFPKKRKLYLSKSQMEIAYERGLINEK
ncbi:TPA: PrgI family protein [Streptococcus pyogenes]